MEQRLMAFWRYDTAPYVLSGEITAFTDKGGVVVKGYESRVFKPIKILPYEAGAKIAEAIKELGQETRRKEAELHAECRNAVDRLLGGE